LVLWLQGYGYAITSKDQACRTASAPLWTTDRHDLFVRLMGLSLRPLYEGAAIRFLFGRLDLFVVDHEVLMLAGLISAGAVERFDDIARHLIDKLLAQAIALCRLTLRTETLL
jgi:hypothetical protein